MAKIIGRWKLKTGADGKVKMERAPRKTATSTKIRQKNSNKSRPVRPGTLR